MLRVTLSIDGLFENKKNTKIKVFAEIKRQVLTFAGSGTYLKYKSLFYSRGFHLSYLFQKQIVNF